MRRAATACFSRTGVIASWIEIGRNSNSTAIGMIDASAVLANATVRSHIVDIWTIGPSPSARPQRRSALVADRRTACQRLRKRRQPE